ncbi:hypothetical protein DV737_g4712, partial [Chaetothyriales sp. CBS 132003]
MSFRKRNVGISANVKPADKAAPPPTALKSALPGVRPSTLDGRPVTSTGTAALDGLLAGHGGLALGCSVLIGEAGTTDYAGALLKFFAAEGLLQGHHVHVVGLPAQWGRGLPGLVDERSKGKTVGGQDRMKIAWRYQGLGELGSVASQRESVSTSKPGEGIVAADTRQRPPFNHSFDLTKRLAHPAGAVINFIPLSASSPAALFHSVLQNLQRFLTTSPPNTVHRLIVPSFLSPLLYPPFASSPHHILGFMHSLRSLLATFNLTVLLTLPLSLYPRSSGLVRWMELLSDGVLELAPFPHTAVAVSTRASSTTDDDPPQGLLRVHKLPILHELGSGTQSYDDDWSFSLSRRRLAIKPFNLPPLDDDLGGSQTATADPAAGGAAKAHSKQAAKSDLEF